MQCSVVYPAITISNNHNTIRNPGTKIVQGKQNAKFKRDNINENLFTI